MSRWNSKRRTGKMCSHAFLLLFAIPLLRAQPGPDDVFEYLSLDFPGLEKVREAVRSGELPKARAALLSYFQTRPNRLGDDLYAAGEGNSQVARENAGNRFSWKGTAKAFGATVDWRFIGPDREWNYSLNRMLWFENFVAVYSRTRDEGLVRAWREQILSWIRLGDPGFPRTIDTGRRLESLVSSYWMFITQLRSPSIDPEMHAVLLASIHEQCEYLYNPDHWRRYSNWGTFESSGLARAAVLFPEFKRSTMWLRELFFRMQVQIGLSYYPDGMHVELSPSYHAGELQMWFDFVRLAERNGIVSPWQTQSAQPSAAALFRNPARALMYLVTPNGGFPQAGDTDDSVDLDLLGGMSTYLDDSQMRFVATRGRDGSPPVESSHAFPDAGYFILRSGWGDAGRPFGDQMYLMFDATVNTPWHAHRDAFNVLFNAFGRKLLLDAGRFTYNDGPERELFLGAASHNTVVIDRQDQKKHDPKPEAWWKFFRSFDCVSATRRQGDVRHERTVCLIKPDYAVIVDRLAGKGSHQYQQYWHLDPGGRGEVSLAGSVVFSPNFLLCSTAPEGSLGVGTGWVSRRYREKTEGPVVTCSWDAEGETAVATLLYPFGGEMPRVEITDITPREIRGRSMVLKIDNGRFQDMVYMRGDTARNVGDGVATDADVLFLRREGRGVQGFAAARCSSLIIDGKVHYATPGVRTDVSFDGECLEIRGVNIRRCEARVPGTSRVFMNEETVPAKRSGEMLICE